MEIFCHSISNCWMFKWFSCNFFSRFHGPIKFKTLRPGKNVWKVIMSNAFFFTFLNFDSNCTEILSIWKQISFGSSNGLSVNRSQVMNWSNDDIYWADSRFAPSQWETVLLCNDVSHWLGASLESALRIYVIRSHRVKFSHGTTYYAHFMPNLIPSLTWLFAT